MESVSSNIGITLHQLVQRNTEALFVNTVLPSFEKAMRDMFQQLNEAFRRGLAECELHWGIYSCTAHVNVQVMSMCTFYFILSN